MNLTPDLVIYQIIPSLSINEIMQLCQTNSSMRTICQNERLWESLIKRDFADSGLKSNNLSWFQYYVTSTQYRNLILSKYPDAPIKPNGISYLTYTKLLQQSNTIMLQSYLGNRTMHLGSIYIIPRITTLGFLIETIEEKTERATIYNYDYTMSFKVFNSQQRNMEQIFLLVNKNNEIITTYEYGMLIAGDNLQTIFGTQNLILEVYKGVFRVSDPYYISDDDRNIYLLR